MAHTQTGVETTVARCPVYETQALSHCVPGEISGLVGGIIGGRNFDQSTQWKGLQLNPCGTF